MIDVATSLAGAEILLAGGNGFLGKVILGLLLDRYPEIGRVHFLIRPRGGASGRERFERDVLASPALADLVARRGRAFVDEKVTVWEGDAAQANCGLAPEAALAWKGRLRLILNCAGLVEFFPPVDQSLAANVDSARHLADMAAALDAALLHISTCYVAGRADGLIEESEPIRGFYPLRKGLGDHAFNAVAELALLRARIAEATDDGLRRDRDALDALVQLGRGRAERWGWANTYTFTKSLAEQILSARDDLRLSIVRPAIVESAVEFPFPGWVEGGRTAAPLVLMALSGMTDWPAREDLALEIVPVDQIAAATLAVAGALVQGRAAPVYHLASADRNPFAMRPLLELLRAEGRRRGAKGGPLRTYGEDAYRSWLARAKARARRGETRLSRLASRLEAWGLPGAGAVRAKAADLRRLGLQIGFREGVLDQYLPFILENRFVFEAQNIRDTYAELTPEDRRRLPWTPEAIDWPEYWRKNQIEGVLKWVQPETVRDWSFGI